MSTMINTYCRGCGNFCGEISVYDAPYTGEPTCWSCLDEAEYAEFLAWQDEMSFTNE